MKFTYGSLIFITAFMLYYFIFSAIGALFVGSYHAVVTNSDWFIMFSLFFGWWLAAGTMMEILDRYFKN